MDAPTGRRQDKLPRCNSRLRSANSSGLLQIIWPSSSIPSSVPQSRKGWFSQSNWPSSEANERWPGGPHAMSQKASLAAFLFIQILQNSNKHGPSPGILCWSTAKVIRRQGSETGAPLSLIDTATPQHLDSSFPQPWTYDPPRVK